MPPCTCLTCTQSLNNTLPSSLPPGTTDDDRWASFGQMDPDEDLSTPEEVAALREFAEAYRTAEQPPLVAEAARRLMSLSEERVPCDGDHDKGSRVAWLLWQAGLAMPHHQTAILEVVDAVEAMPRLEATEEQERRFGKEKLEKWRGLEEFWCGFWGEKYQINDSLCLGDYDAGLKVPILREHNITAIVSMSDGPDSRWGKTRNRMLVPADRHLFIPWLDSSTQDLLVQMPEICDFIDKMLDMPPSPKPRVPLLASEVESGIAPDSELDEIIPPRVLVHCNMGISRSATAVIAYLMRKTGRSLEDVLAEVKQKRKIKPNPNFMEQLRVWDEVGYNPWQDEERTVPKEPYRVYLEGRAARLKAKGLTGNEPTWPQQLTGKKVVLDSSDEHRPVSD
ncbi:hypothetical protein NEMBOFW57_007648 [Staphylotrichum longicolle]|uniref:protein-tyrosine-phosphatase n=1 Tax=Staphylotrichum longicolle TaxID=669026 RepID=A0AAD4EVV4_9PEZI|nr:hypothetical protein NEMBOFW57_007648 [Staphylotrichum longicolle]